MASKHETLVNLSSFEITLVVGDTKLTFRPSGVVAKLNPTKQEKLDEMSETWNLPIYTPVDYESIQHLPETTSTKSVDIIVNPEVAEFIYMGATEHEGTVLYPDMSPSSLISREGNSITIKRFCSYD